MLKNLITIALRNLSKDKGYSLLNILGLTIGITCSLLLIFYVLDELSYDRHHAKADRIFRIASYVQEPNNSMRWSVTPYPLSQALKQDYPEVEEAVHFINAGRVLFGTGERKIAENKVFFADSNVFRIFSHPFIEGDPATALKAPNSMVITRELAEKYFGNDKKAVGESLQTSTGRVCKVTGVIENLPRSSHFRYDVLLSNNSNDGQQPQNGWGNFGLYTYVLLKPGVDREAFEKKLLPMYGKYLAPIFEQYNIKMQFGVQPVTDIHLHSDLGQEPEELGSMSYIYILSSVAIFLLLIASINYMNMTTARSARRAREIGIRKVSGSSRGQLVLQFISESLVMTLISAIISMGLLYLVLPPFNALAGKFISYGYIFKPVSLLVFAAVIFFVGVAAGSYPALYLSGFNPVSVLKGNLAKASSNVVLRRILVIAQFTISMVMIICTLVVYSQLRYMRNFDLGFNKDQVINVPVNRMPNLRTKLPSLMNALRQIKGITAVSCANGLPGSSEIAFNLFSVETDQGYRDKGVDCYAIDDQYIPTLGIKLIKGRGFSLPSDTLTSIIVNEKLVKEFGWKDPLGKKVKFPGDTTNSFVQVIGVVKDFHQKSLYNPIAPLIFFYQPTGRFIQLRLQAGLTREALSGAESEWKIFFHGEPFNYSFLDEDLNSQYRADEKRGRIYTTFSIITILITCLGLTGLIAFTTQQRQKEISIRKVMGAGLRQIVPLLARNFVWLVGFSCLLAFPFAFYFMNKWMEVFPYKAGLHPFNFILSALIVLLITLVTISFHTIKVALSNPVKALRTE
jgi:putative ABC transport system permease protein